MNVDGREPQISPAKGRKTALRNRLGAVSSASGTLEASLQLLQGLACERSEALPPLIKRARGDA